MYLTREATDRLMAEITGLSARGSAMVSEYFVRVWRNEDVQYDALDEEEKAAWNLLTNVFRYGPVDDNPDKWLASHSWAPTEVTTLTEESRKEGHAIPDDFGRPGANDVWLFSGVQGRSHTRPFEDSA
ncbi:hypothetical protein ABZ883_22700 [Streptomyces sp. NPDC046977]|uniref:hypothetical protein n=1 Tax=Streptomyces sp. NPDC046977 TaxID=3154703 RepID=UPI0033DC9C36